MKPTSEPRDWWFIAAMVAFSPLWVIPILLVVTWVVERGL